MMVHDYFAILVVISIPSKQEAVSAKIALITQSEKGASKSILWKTTGVQNGTQTQYIHAQCWACDLVV